MKAKRNIAAPKTCGKPKKAVIPKGFTKWEGGLCPVHRETTVEVLQRGTQRTQIGAAWLFPWLARRGADSILAYRIMRSQQSEKQPAETTGPVDQQSAPQRTKLRASVDSLGEWPPVSSGGSTADLKRSVAELNAGVEADKNAVGMTPPAKWKPDGLSLVVGYVVGIAFVWLLQAFVKVAA